MMKFSWILLTLALIISSPLLAQNVGIGTNSPNAKLDVVGNLALREGTALSFSNGANNDVTLTSPVSSVYRIVNPTASFSLSGIAAGQNGQIVTLINTTANDFTLVNDATSSTNNRLYLPGGASRTIGGAYSSVTLQYNSSLARWIVTDISSDKDGINWSLSGNAGTTSGTNFIGTTDSQDFMIKTGGSASGNERIKATGTGDVIINEQGNANDVRIETDNDANALIVKGSTDNIGIGTNPDAKAKLDISATDKGLLIPRVALTSTTAPIGNPKPTGLMVYNTSVSGTYAVPGIYMWDGTDWQRIILNSTLSGSLQPLSSTGGGGLQFSPGSYNGGTSTTVGIATDGINNGMLQDNIVTTNEILNGTVGTADLATPAVNASNQIFNTLPVSNGGTGQSSLSANGVLIGNGTSAVSVSGAPSPGQVLVGNASNVPTFTSLGGDVSSVSATGNLQLISTGVSAATYGSSTKAPIITVDAKGRLTSASDVTISGTVPGGAAGGDLSGTYPNPTVAKINGASLGTTTASNANILVANGTSWNSVGMSGDVTINNAGVSTIGSGKVVTGMILDGTISTVDLGNSQVSYAKIQNVSASRLLGNPTGSAAAPSEISLGTGLSFSGTVLNGNVGTVTSIATNNGITGGTITGTGTIGLTGNALALHNLSSNGMIVKTGSGTLTTRTITTSGTGIGVTNGDGISGNPTISLNYGPSLASASNGQFPVGNFGQYENHGAYTDFNTTPNYWGWNYVQGSANGPNATSSQWYRENISLGSNYAGRGTGGYSLELAFPRFSASQAGVWMRTVENGSIGSWVQISGPPIGSIIAFNKGATGVPSLPDGWVECNGQTLADAGSPLNNTVIPNLNGGASSAFGGTTGAGRYLRGSTTAGSFQADQLPNMEINQSSTNQGTGSGTVANDGTTANYSGWLNNYYLCDSFRWRYTGREVRPLSYTVVWIMRVK